MYSVLVWIRTYKFTIIIYDILRKNNGLKSFVVQRWLSLRCSRICVLCLYSMAYAIHNIMQLKKKYIISSIGKPREKPNVHYMHDGKEVKLDFFCRKIFLRFSYKSVNSKRTRLLYYYNVYINAVLMRYDLRTLYSLLYSFVRSTHVGRRVTTTETHYRVVVLLLSSSSS